MSEIPSKSTQLIHHPYNPPAGFDAVPPGIYKASTIIFPSVAALRSRDWKHKTGYTYGLHGTPTTFTLEERIATLEGGRFCTLVPSGLAAVVLVDMAFLKAGDEVLIPDNAYGPNKAFAHHELAGWGITHQFYDPMNPADLAARLSPRTRLVWLEAPGSITMEFPDLPALVAVVKAHGGAHPQGIVTALDNTWGAGLAFNAFALGVDVSMQALTKYPSGGADVLMGSVVTNHEALHDLLHMSHMRVGFGVSGNDCELVLRGLGSMALRYAAQDAATRQLALWLQQQPPIAAVLHPALPGSPGHAAWKRDCSAAACLVSAVFQPGFTQPQIDRFCDSLKLFRLGYSWAGPMSLCVPYDMSSIRPKGWPHAGGLVRFSVGLEAVADLQGDISQALGKA
ncbi:MAG: cystathionine beta-lyase [Polaromonas sp. 35-63-240]|jgi:cystathionine beta-lyase|uniref:PLP-dependent transferase n=1 Tax=Polaromonas sp. TaxID=1869339 RepID=UPI000BCF508C|nr:PLP-dependent transferase [Polaromonas sp.]OYY53047.1 MAG: cystathionine beta-lyase [Polaromonas sp. 35-63-240]OYY97736.1 MAG: cystathionine beta-lyase [Polaromonas sp. 28-63-22]HQS30868.1 PLP-dependent transferase [Polaromonas sp.]HQS92406.1 PLP-dependent transferase [Polaromonas sp.]